jgi:hypothetical protein
MASSSRGLLGRTARKRVSRPDFVYRFAKKLLRQTRLAMQEPRVQRVEILRIGRMTEPQSATTRP